MELGILVTGKRCAHDVEEHFAELLFTSDLYSLSLDAMRLLKQKGKVPIGIMIKRLEDLKMISKEQAKRLWIGKSRRRWKEGAEPLDDELAHETPNVSLF
jgi:hypothetical protein